jgi:hypothetical protein
LRENGKYCSKSQEVEEEEGGTAKSNTMYLKVINDIIGCLMLKDEFSASLKGAKKKDPKPLANFWPGHGYGKYRNRYCHTDQCI